MNNLLYKIQQFVINLRSFLHTNCDSCEKLRICKDVKVDGMRFCRDCFTQYNQNGGEIAFLKEV